MKYNASIFNNIPMEFHIPNGAKVIFVADFFSKDLKGGAEFTTDAIIKKSPVRCFELHAKSLTKELLEKHKDKYWVFGNFATMSPEIIDYLPTSSIQYSILEFDFKFCSFRSTNKHQQTTGTACDCAKLAHGLDIARMFQKADRIFWMSEGQKKAWLSYVPELANHPGHIVLSSAFSDEDLDYIRKLRELRTMASRNGKLDMRWAVLGSGSWIKGVEETQKWCKLNRKEFAPIPNSDYHSFLSTISHFRGFVFMPLDKDTCPRITIEAKLLGLDLICNDNVLSKNDEWFTGTIEDCEAYLRSRPSVFWSSLRFI